VLSIANNNNLSPTHLKGYSTLTVCSLIVFYLLSYVPLKVNSNQIQRIRNIRWSLLSKLEVLDLSDNKLDAIETTALCRASSLTSLLLDNNSIAEVPPELGLLPDLRHLGLYGNPQRSIRTHVLQQGTGAVLKVSEYRHADVERIVCVFLVNFSIPSRPSLEFLFLAMILNVLARLECHETRARKHVPDRYYSIPISLLDNHVYLFHSIFVLSPSYCSVHMY